MSYDSVTSISHILKVQTDYVISELYVQIENSSDESIETEVEFTFTGNSSSVYNYWGLAEVGFKYSIHIDFLLYL